MKIGIIGGSGLYDLEGLENVKKEKVSTPFGDPSDEYVSGTLAGKEIFFLPRHGVGHTLLPSEINHRANICGFKMLGVERILSMGAVGSLREELRPRDVVLPDQYFDRTKSAMEHTFFGKGFVAHVGFSEPACSEFRSVVADAAKKVVSEQPEKSDVNVNVGGTYVNMEGPAFSTKAESHVYRKLGFDVIGMTGLAEAKLAREAEICFQGISMVTDYDCWRESEDAVNIEIIISHLMANTALLKLIIKEVASTLDADRTCGCSRALEDAILTRKEAVSDEVKKRLAPIIGKYID